MEAWAALHEVVRRVERYRARAFIAVAVLMLTVLCAPLVLMMTFRGLHLVLLLGYVGISRVFAGHIAARRLPVILDEVARERGLSLEELDAEALRHDSPLPE